MLPTMFQVDWPFGSGEDAKLGFQSDHLGLLIGTILLIFYLQVTAMLRTKFQVNYPFGSGEEAKNRFSIWPPLNTIKVLKELRGGQLAENSFYLAVLLQRSQFLARLFRRKRRGIVIALASSASASSSSCKNLDIL